jgi:hypothetical protein
MDLRPKPSPVPACGSFDPQVEDAAVLVPAPLLSILRDQGINTVEELLSVSLNFPSSLAAKLDWTVPQVTAARRQLARLVAGKVPDAFVEERPRQFATGALPPFVRE